MTEKTLYICDFCGETFDDEDSCLIHEEREKHKKFKNRVAFFDGDGNQVKQGKQHGISLSYLAAFIGLQYAESLPAGLYRLSGILESVLSF